MLIGKLVMLIGEQALLIGELADDAGQPDDGLCDLLNLPLQHRHICSGLSLVG